MFVVIVLLFIMCCVCFGGRGFPVWLKYVPGITFRTDNEPFKVRERVDMLNLGYMRSNQLSRSSFLTQVYNVECYRMQCKDLLRKLLE